MAYRYGQMVRAMKESGKKIRLMERANFGMSTEMYLMASGRMIRLTGMEYTHIKMERNTKAIGRMICRTDGA